MRKRAGALYIQNKKLFLICENKQGFYWTPGGGVEASETYEEALQREVSEELAATLASTEPYMTIVDTADYQEVHYFLATIDLPPKLPDNLETHWYARDDFHANNPQISPRVFTQVYPQLIADGLV